MIRISPARRTIAALLLFLFSFSTIAQATPFGKNPFQQDDDKKVKKLPPANWIRSRKIDVKHIALDLKIDWNKSQVYGTEMITLAPLSDLDSFPLDAASMSINSVTMAGETLKFNYDVKKSEDNLEIMLGRIYPSGGDITVKIDYRTNYVNKADADTAIGNFGRGVRFIKPTDDDPGKPMQVWSQGETEFNRYWFPSYDSPNDFRTTDIKVTVEKPYTVISNGKLVETKENSDNTHTFDWKMDTPYSNYLTSIVIGKYKEVVQNFDGIPVIAYGYPNETKEVAATVKNLPATIKFFSDITGVKYAYPKYSQAFVEDFGGGMENISATTQIEEMIHDDRELLDDDSEGLQSHELAHQWFGDYVTCREWGQIWLNESFATYFQALWDEKFKGHDYFLYNDVRLNQEHYYDTWNEGNRHPIVTKYYANKDAMFDRYAYERGGAVLHMLRKHLGDKAFFASLNHYLITNAHQPVSTEDLRIAIEETTGQSMDWFFDEWLYRMGHPVFEVTQNYDEAAKKLTLNVKQTQKVDILNEYPQVEFFQTNVDVEIDGKVQRVWIEPKAENVFTFDSPVKPKIVNFDYESTLIKEIKFDKSSDDLAYQMVNDKDALGRHWAMLEIVKREGDADEKLAMNALLTMADKDTLAENRRAAIEEIRDRSVTPAPPGMDAPPAQLDAATIKVLQKAVKDTNPLVRADAIALLGVTADPKYSDIYLAAMTDRSYGVIDSAADALGQTKNPKAFDAFMKLASTTSWHGRLQAAGLSGLAELGDKRAFEFAYKTASDKTAAASLRNAAMEVVGATGKGNPKAFPLVFDRFKNGLESRNGGILFSTIHSIIKLADPRGQEAFDMLKAAYKDDEDVMALIAMFEKQFKEGLGK